MLFDRFLEVTLQPQIQIDAILFVAPRERRMLGAIERATRKKITELELPSTEIVNKKRIADFKQKITETIASGHLAFMRGIIEEYQGETEASASRQGWRDG